MTTLVHILRLAPVSSADRRASKRSRRNDPQPSIEPPADPTSNPVNPDEPEEPEEPEEIELPCTDDADWEVFVPDHDWDPMPEPGDFWIEDPEDMRAASLQ